MVYVTFFLVGYDNIVPQPEPKLQVLERLLQGGDKMDQSHPYKCVLQNE